MLSQRKLKWHDKNMGTHQGCRSQVPDMNVLTGTFLSWKHTMTCESSTHDIKGMVRCLLWWCCYEELKFANDVRGTPCKSRNSIVFIHLSWIVCLPSLQALSRLVQVTRRESWCWWCCCLAMVSWFCFFLDVTMKSSYFNKCLFSFIYSTRVCPEILCQTLRVWLPLQRRNFLYPSCFFKQRRRHEETYDDDSGKTQERPFCFFLFVDWHLIWSWLKIHWFIHDDCDFVLCWRNKWWEWNLFLLEHADSKRSIPLDYGRVRFWWCMQLIIMMATNISQLKDFAVLTPQSNSDCCLETAKEGNYWRESVTMRIVCKDCRWVDGWRTRILATSCFLCCHQRFVSPSLFSSLSSWLFLQTWLLPFLSKGNLSQEQISPPFERKRSLSSRDFSRQDMQDATLHLKPN